MVPLKKKTQSTGRLGLHGTRNDDDLFFSAGSGGAIGGGGADNPVNVNTVVVVPAAATAHPAGFTNDDANVKLTNLEQRTTATTENTAPGKENRG